MDSSSNPRVIEKKLNQIQASTRTTLPLFIRPHNWLRMHSSLYYKWHLLPFVKAFHVLVLVAFLTNSIFFVKNNLLFASSVQATSSATVIDTTNSGTWNIRIDGVAESDNLGLIGTKFADIDADGVKDLLIATPSTDYNSRSNSGSVYLIKGTALSSYTGTGTTIDLSNSANYFLRIDGPASQSLNLVVGSNVVVPGDYNSDGKIDLLISSSRSDNGATDNGSIYLLDNALITAYSGTGNTLDLADTSKFTVRFDGSTNSSVLGFDLAKAAPADMDGDGLNDLIMGEPGLSPGHAYIVFGPLLRSYFGGTGSIKSLATSTSYNLKISGTGGINVLFADYNNDGRLDVITEYATAANNSRSASGSIYFYPNNIIAQYASTTGNVISPVTDSSIYALRIDGAFANDRAGRYYLGLADINGNGVNDLLIGSYLSGHNSRASSGNLYILTDDKFANTTGVGNTLDLLNNYWITIDGSGADVRLADFGTSVGDFFNTGKNDLLIAAHRATGTNGTLSGRYYIFKADRLRAYTGLGNAIDTADDTKYDIGIDGYASGDRVFPGGPNNVEDFNNDGSLDIVYAAFDADMNSRTGSGSVYIIYNFPHAFTNVSGSGDTASATRSISGTVNAASSTTTITKVQYNIGSNSPSSGSWTDCSATDGSFNGTSETFSCSLTLGSTGTERVYLRAQDSLSAYSAVSNYGSVSFSYALPATETSATATPATTSSDTTAPSLTLKTIGTGTFKSTTTKFTYTASKPQPVFAGTSETGATVTVKTGETTLCTTTAKSDGVWSCKTTSVLKFQDYKITLTASDSAGNTTTHRTFTLVVAEPQAGQAESAVSSEEDTSLDPALETVANTAAKETVLSALPVYETQVVTTASGDALTVWKVKVKDRKDQPLASAPVSLSTTDQAAVTDEQGVATFMNVPLGDHELVYESKSKTLRARVQALLPSGLANTKGTFTLLPADVTLPLGGPPLPWPAMVLVILLAPMIGGFIMYELTKHRVRSWEGLFERKKELTNFLP